MTIVIDDHVRLELTASKHAEALYAAINTNRAHLSAFLPWVETMQSLEIFNRYINNAEQLYQQLKEVSFVVFWDDIPVGKIGLHYIDGKNKNALLILPKNVRIFPEIKIVVQQHHLKSF